MFYRKLFIIAQRHFKNILLLKRCYTHGMHRNKVKKMVTKAKNLDDFMNEQSISASYYVVSPGNVLSEVFVYPYSTNIGLMSELKISIPKDAISAVTPLGITTEIDLKHYQVVTIKFTGDNGIIYENIFEDLINNATQKKQIDLKTKNVSLGLQDEYKPMRDWCGWHWPTR